MSGKGIDIHDENTDDAAKSTMEEIKKKTDSSLVRIVDYDFGFSSSSDDEESNDRSDFLPISQRMQQINSNKFVDSCHGGRLGAALPQFEQEIEVKDELTAKAIYEKLKQECEDTCSTLSSQAESDIDRSSSDSTREIPDGDVSQCTQPEQRPAVEDYFKVKVVEQNQNPDVENNEEKEEKAGDGQIEEEKGDEQTQMEGVDNQEHREENEEQKHEVRAIEKPVCSIASMSMLEGEEECVLDYDMPDDIQVGNLCTVASIRNAENMNFYEAYAGQVENEQLTGIRAGGYSAKQCESAAQSVDTTDQKDVNNNMRYQNMISVKKDSVESDAISEDEQNRCEDVEQDKQSVSSRKEEMEGVINGEELSSKHSKKRDRDSDSEDSNSDDEEKAWRRKKHIDVKLDNSSMYTPQNNVHTLVHSNVHNNVQDNVHNNVEDYVHNNVQDNVHNNVHAHNPSSKEEPGNHSSLPMDVLEVDDRTPCSPLSRSAMAIKVERNADDSAPRKVKTTDEHGIVYRAHSPEEKPGLVIDMPSPPRHTMTSADDAYFCQTLTDFQDDILHITDLRVLSDRYSDTSCKQFVIQLCAILKNDSLPDAPRINNRQVLHALYDLCIHKNLAADAYKLYGIVASGFPQDLPHFKVHTLMAILYNDRATEHLWFKRCSAMFNFLMKHNYYPLQTYPLPNDSSGCIRLDRNYQDIDICMVITNYLNTLFHRCANHLQTADGTSLSHLYVLLTNSVNAPLFNGFGSLELFDEHYFKRIECVLQKDVQPAIKVCACTSGDVLELNTEDLSHYMYTMSLSVKGDSGPKPAHTGEYSSLDNFEESELRYRYGLFYRAKSIHNHRSIHERIGSSGPRGSIHHRVGVKPTTNIHDRLGTKHDSTRHDSNMHDSNRYDTAKYDALSQPAGDKRQYRGTMHSCISSTSMRHHHGNNYGRCNRNEERRMPFEKVNFDTSRLPLRSRLVRSVPCSNYRTESSYRSQYYDNRLSAPHSPPRPPPRSPPRSIQRSLRQPQCSPPRLPQCSPSRLSQRFPPRLSQCSPPRHRRSGVINLRQTSSHRTNIPGTLGFGMSRHKPLPGEIRLDDLHYKTLPTVAADTPTDLRVPQHPQPSVGPAPPNNIMQLNSAAALASTAKPEDVKIGVGMILSYIGQQVVKNNSNLQL